MFVILMFVLHRHAYLVDMQVPPPIPPPPPGYGGFPIYLVDPSTFLF